MKVFINPGHDIKYDPGAVNKALCLTEARVALDVGKLVATYLSKAGIEVVVMQSDNLYYDSSYTDRAKPVCVASDEWGADLFVSLHCNACNGSASGTEALVYSINSKAKTFADAVLKQLVPVIGSYNRGVKERPDLIVLKHTEAPACLIEMAFIDNNQDAYKLINKQDEIARAIARAVTDYQLLIRG